MVHMPHGEVDVNGRLLTVDGFALAPEQSAAGASLSATPTLTADLSVTTYLTPADQGITAGATLSGPAPATRPVTPTRVEHDHDLHGSDLERASSDAMKNVQNAAASHRPLPRPAGPPAAGAGAGARGRPDRGPGGALELLRDHVADGAGRAATAERIGRGRPPPRRRC